MKIGISGPINPFELKDFFPDMENIPVINKGASAVNTYVRELIRQGHKVVVFTSAVPSNEPNDIVIKGDNIEIHIIHSTPGLFFTHALSRVYMVRRIKKYIRSYIGELDVLHSQWTYDFALAAKAFENKLPVFCTVRDWCPYIMSIQRGFKKIQWVLYYFIFKKVMNSKHIHFIANSEYTRKQIASLYPFKPIDVIYNPIDKELILDNKKNLVSDLVFVSIASSLTESRKNVKKLLEAFKIFRQNHYNCKLFLIGSGLEVNNPAYQEYQSNGLLNGVECLGQLKHKDLIEAIDKSICLIHPSLEETFGNILLEGMARRVVVIGGEHSGAVPAVLDNGNCGILCNVLNVHSIAEAMEKATNRDISDRLIEKATELLREKYSSESIVNQHIALYGRYL